jgi:hypothetical protein
MILMILLAALGIAMLAEGVWRNANRPITPLTSDGMARYAPQARAMDHV